MKTVPYKCIETEVGGRKYITPCPFGKSISNSGLLIKVGSKVCGMCTKFHSKNITNETVNCKYGESVEPRKRRQEFIG